MKLALVHRVAFAIWLAVSTAFGATIIVPSQFANTEAGSSDNAPLGVSEQHFQQVFSSTLLTDLSVGDLINGLAFRVEGNETALPAQTISTYDISLSHHPTRRAVSVPRLSATGALISRRFAAGRLQ